MVATYRGAGLICACLSVALYLNTLDCGFSFDDDAAVENNPDIRPNVSWSNLLENDFWGTPMSSSGSHKSYRPLCVATFRLNYLLHELQPMGYHLVNILLHGAVCYLYVQLCGLVLSQVWPALIAGLLFAVHPIHTEAVAGVVGRADVLSGLFFVISLLTYRQAAIRNGLSCYMWLLCCLIFVLCAALSKETGLTVVGVAVIYELSIIRHMTIYSTLSLLRGNFPSWFRSFLLRVLALVVFLMSFLMLRIRLNQGSPKFSKHDNPALFSPSPSRQLHWSYLSAFNLKLLIDPSYLCCEYSLSTIPLIKTWTDPRNTITLLTLCLVFFSGVYSIKKSSLTRRIILFGLSLIVFPYLPASNLFFPVGFVVAERVLYLPSMGVCLLVGHGAWILVQWIHKATSVTAQQRFQKIIFMVFFISLLVSHSAKTLFRNRDWYSSNTLFLSAIKVTPNNGKMISNLGTSFGKLKERNLSEMLFRYGSQVEPFYTANWMNLATLLREDNQPFESIKVYKTAADLVTRGLANEPGIYFFSRDVKVYNSLSNMLREHTNNNIESLHYADKAIQHEPQWVNSHHSRGKILLKMQYYKEAKVSFLEAIKIDPNISIVHSNLGETLFKLEEYNLSEKHLRRSLEIASDSMLSKFRLANLLVQMEQSTPSLLMEAENLLLEVIEAEPTNGNATFCLGLVYYDLQKFSLAEDYFTQSLTMSPHHPGSLLNLGGIFTMQKRYREAVDYLEELIAHYPSHASGLSQLATCYQLLGERDKAKETFSRVLESDPNHLQSLQNLGVMLIQDGDIDSAIDMFERLVLVNPTDKSIKQQLDILMDKKKKHK